MKKKEELMLDGANINEVQISEVKNIEKDMNLLIITLIISSISIIIALITCYI